MKNINKHIEGLPLSTYCIDVRSCKVLQKMKLAIVIQFIIVLSAGAQVTETLFLSDPLQTLDRIDPVATNDNTTATTSVLNPIILGAITDSITALSYSGDHSAGPLGWTSDWIETELNPPPADPPGVTGGYVRGDEFPVGSGSFDIGIIDVNVGDNIIRSFDLTGVDSAEVVLNLGANYGNPINTDIWRLSVSSDGGLNYTTLLDMNKDDAYSMFSLPLSTFTSNMVIKYELVSNGGSLGTGMSINNISINYRIPASGPQTFTMDTPFCSDFTIEGGQNFNVTTHASINYGTVPANPDVDVVLEYGAGPTTIIDLSGTTPTWDGSTFTWSGTIPSNMTIPAGEEITLRVINNDPNFTCQIDFDSDTHPSSIDIPALDKINIDGQNVYDAAYSGGAIITEHVVGTTVYLRSTVSNPFGPNDIDSYEFSITDPTSGVSNYSGVEVASSGCTKTFEYAWTVPTIGGTYEIIGTAYSGGLGNTDKDTIPFQGLIPVVLNKTLVSPVSGPYTIDDTLVYNIEVQNSSALSITTLPLQDLFDDTCLEYITSSVAPQNVANGSILWDDLGALGAYSSTNLNVTLKVIGNCEPTRNIAKIEGAIYNSLYALPAVQDTLDISVDEPPVAIGDLYHITGFTNFGVLDNDTDPDNDMITLSIVTPPSAGTATPNGTTVDFDPTGMSEDETVSFRYRICDNASPTPYCAEADVIVVYSAINNAPTLVNDVISTTLNLGVVINVLDNDSDIDGSLDFSSMAITVDPQFGTATINPDGTITYIPNNEYFGADQLTYTICDDGSPLPAECSSAVVNITVVYVHYVCKSSNATISVPAVAGAESYVWDLPAGAVIISGGGTNEVVVDFSAVAISDFEICVEPSNFCGVGTEQCVDIVITDIGISSDVTDVQCLGDDSGSIDITVAGGVSPFSYNWSNGSSVEDLQGVLNGTYSVTVTDRYGCSATASESISQPPTSVFISGAVVTDENPYGSRNGSIDLTVSGGTPGYSFVWTNALGELVFSSEDPVGLQGGTYTVVVTDSNGCSDTGVYTVNTVGGPLTIDALITTEVDCYGGTTGAINLEVIGGSGSYTYDWDNDGVGDFDDTQDLSNIPEGTYTVVVDDGVNPTVTSSIDVLEPVAPVSINTSATNLSCFESDNGSVDMTVTGGTGPYTYAWNTGSASEDIVGLSIGTYSVTVTDFNGCQAFASETITQPSEILVNGISSDDVCGPSSNGSIDISVSGGSGTYTFEWSNGETTEDISNLSVGLYSVIVYDNTGCFNSATFNIESACLGTSKMVVGTPVNNGDGTYLVTYQIAAQNYGTVTVDSIQIVEDLSTTFNDAIGFNLENISIISQPSQTWTLNPNFDGDPGDGDLTDATDFNMLDSFGELQVGERTVFEIEVTVEPGSILTYDNYVVGNGTSTLGKVVSDQSQDGNDADPDGDGDPTNNNDPTPVTLVEDPIIGLAKNLGLTVTNNQDGTYSLNYELRVENVGDVDLDSIQITDDLQLTFPGMNISGVGLSIIEQPISSVLSLNGAYDGLTAGDVNLLDGLGSLHVGEFARFNIDLTVEINGSLGIFYNSSSTSGISPAGTTVTDVSQDGVDVDPDNDGDPTNNNDPTPVSFLENPVVNIVKKLEGTPIRNSDGSQTIKYYLEVSNQGDVPLLNVQIQDNLNDAFPGLALSNVSSNIVTQPFSTTLVSNINFDGLTSGDIDLLSSGGRLNVGEIAIFEINATVALNGSLGPFTNVAVASGNGPGGTPASDSDDEVVVFSESPSIGLAKTVDTPVNNQNGTYSLNYTILVENTGETTLRNIQIQDDLSATFEIAGFNVTSISSSTLNVNGSYNGIGGGDLDLLDGTDSLNVGESATIVVGVMVTPGTKLGIYYNSAVGTAFGSGGSITTDISQNGTDVDPDNDGDPTNNNDPTPVSFLENPILGFAKDIVTSVTNNMDGSFSFVYEIRAENMGDVPLYNVQIVDDLALTFALADDFTVDGYSIVQQPASGGWNTSSNFDGSSNINLLTGTETLNVGQYARLQIQMTVTPGAFGGPYWNSAIGFGTSPSGRTVSDYSQDGLDVDPDNDGIPTNNNDPTPVTFFVPNTTFAFDDFNQTRVDIPVSGDLSTNDIDPEGDMQTIYMIAYDSNNDGSYNVTSSLPSGNATIQLSGTDDDGVFTLNAGSITVYENGLYDFTPANGFSGTAYMEYAVIDDNLNPETDNAILVIEVLGDNTGDLYPPIAQDDNATTAPDINVDIEILINDSDVDGYLVNSTIDLNLSNGGIQSSIVVSNEGKFTVNHITGIVTFDPKPNFLGTTTPIDYQVCDNDGLCDEATITVTIYDGKVNIMTAEDDSNIGFSGDTLTGNILINDIDPDGSDGVKGVDSALLDSNGDEQVNNNVTFFTETIVYGESINSPGMMIEAGKLTLDINGDYTYISNPIFEGTVYMPYVACDYNSINACANATLYLTTFKRNTTIAEDDYNQTLIDVNVYGDVSVNDWDPEGDLQTVTSALADTDGDGVSNDIMIINTPTSVYGVHENGDTVVAGLLELDMDGLYSFDPEPTFIGNLYINYTATDDNGSPASDDARLVIDVFGPNVGNLYPPVALDDNATTEPDVNVEIPVLDNDSDVDGVIDPATLDLDPTTAGIQTSYTTLNEGVFTVITSPSTMEQVVLFDPEPDFRGTTTPIDYSICDNDSLCDEAKITVIISDPTINEMTAEDDSNIGDCSGITLTGNILSNDIDPDGSTGVPSVHNALVDSDGSGQVDDVLVLGTPTTVFGEDHNNPGTFVEAGLLTIDSDGTYSYVSDLLFKGTIYIPYTACDNDVNNACDDATLYLTMVRDNPNSIVVGDTILCLGETTTLFPSSGGTWVSSDTSVAVVSNNGNVASISPGTAKFTFTDTSTGCVYNESQEILVNSELSTTIDFVGGICVQPGSELIANPLGGTPLYSYSWAGPNSFTSNSDTIAIVDNGTYTLTVTDALGCTAESSAFVHEAYEPFIFTLSTEICEDEEITLTVNSATAVSYQWDINAGSDTTQSVLVTPGLPSEDYSVTVTNDIGCTTVASVHVDVNPKTIVSVAGVDELCIGDTTHLSPSVGGFWTSSDNSIAGVVASGLVTGLSEGTVTFTFTDSLKNCTSDPTTPVIVHPTPIVSISGPDILCEGDTTYLLPSSGGFWTSSDPGRATVTNDGVVVAIENGTVNFVFTDSTTLCPSAPTTDITINQVYDVSFSGPDSICMGDVTYLLPNTGGTWSSNDETIATVSNDGVVTSISPGSTTFVFTSNLSCVSEPTTPIVIIPNDVITISGDSELCEEDIIPLTANYPNGTWSSSNTSIATVNSNGEVEGIAFGNVTITYTHDPNQCANDPTFDIVIKEKPTVSVDGPVEICAGEVSSVTTNATGGTWLSSDETIAIVSNDGTVVGVSGGSVTFSYLSPNGCESNPTTSIIVNPILNLSIDFLGELCLKNDTKLFANVNGGTGPYTYLWSGPGGFVSTTDTIDVPFSGLYNVIITDSKGCSENQSALVYEAFEPSILALDTEICEGDSVTLSINGSTDGTYQWGSNAGSSTASSVTVSPSVPGDTYYVTVTSPLGCSFVANAVIDVNPLPVITLVGADEICDGGTTNFLPDSGGLWTSDDYSVASITNAGLVVGLGPGATNFTFRDNSTGCYSEASTDITVHPNENILINGNDNLCIGFPESYTASELGGFWSSSNPAVASVDSNGMVTPVSVGTTSLIYTPAPNTCFNIATKSVSVNNIPNVSLNGPSSICQGEITYLVPSTGGSWASSDTSIAIVNAFGEVTGVSGGDAYFTFTSDAGCENMLPNPITVISSPITSIDGPSSICINGSTQLLPNTGGLWISSNNSVAVVNNSGLVTGISDGIASFTFIEYSNGCFGSEVLDITVNETPSISGLLDDDICINETTSISPNSGGFWISSDTTVATISPTGSITGTGAGTATFTFVDSLTGCESNPSQVLVVSSLPNITITGPTAFCVGDNTTILPNSGGVWTSSDVSVATITNSGFISMISSGSVTFTYTSNSSGCSSVPSDTFTVSNPTDATITGPTDLCIGESAILTSTENGTWESSNESVLLINSSGQVTALEPGISTITLVTEAECIQNPTLDIIVNASPMPEFIGPSSICLGLTTSLSPSSGGSWTSSDTTVATVDNAGNVTSVGSGLVFFTFVDSISGCSSTTTTGLSVFEPPIVDILGSDTICIGSTTSLSPSSGGTWTSSNNAVASIDASGIVTGISAGDVTFTFVESSTSCVSDPSNTITVLPKPLVSIVGSNTICVGETTTLSPNSDGAWISSNTNVATVSNSGIVTATGQGVVKFTFVSDEGCASDQTSPVIVYGTPSISIDGDDNLCIGESVQLLPSSGGYWSSSDSTIATINNTGLASALTQGSVTFTYTDTISGCTSLDSDPLTVSPNPTVALNGPDEVCIGTTTNFTPSAGGIWTSLDSTIATIENNGVVTALNSGTVNFLFTELSSGCTSDSTETITVLEEAVPVFTGPQEICVGDSSSLSPNTGVVWTSSNPSVATIDNNGVIIGLTQGIVNFSYTDLSTGCVSGVSDDLIVNGKPTTIITGSSIICIGTTTTLSPSTGGQWTSTNPLVASVTNAGIVTGLMAGTSSFIFLDDSTGCSSNGNISVTVSDDLSVSITGDTEICIGYETTLSPSSGGVWTSSNPEIAIVSNSGIVTGVAEGKVSFEFFETSSGCVSSSVTDEVTIRKCINPDFNVAIANEPVSGNISTNDVFNTFTYGSPIVLEKPLGSLPQFILNSDGSYTFESNEGGKYIYSITTCLTSQSLDCSTEILEVTVADNIYSVSNPIGNLEFGSTYANDVDSLDGNPITLSALANDRCVYTGGCELDSTSLSILGSLSNGSAYTDSYGNIIFTPNPGFIGEETIEYEICSDTGMVCSTSRQIINVKHPSAVNSIDASDDFWFTFKEEAVTGNVLYNDTDPEGDGIQVQPVGSLMAPATIIGGSYFIESNGDFTFFPDDDFVGSTEIIYTVCDDNVDAECISATVHILVFDYMSINVRVYLEGSIMQNGGETSSTSGLPLMRDNLRLSPFDGENKIPNVDPYTFIKDPFTNTPSKYNHIGPHLISTNKEIADFASVMSVTGDNAIVDWVYIELRDKDDMTIPIATRSGLLQRDGDVVDLDGVSSLSFQGINVDSFYVVVKHRTHLGAMSMKVSNTDNLDFTSPDFETYDFGTSLNNGLDYTGLAQKTDMLPNHNVLWGGDFDSNGKIKFTNPNDDQNIMFVNVLFSSPDFLINYDNAYGYLTGDYNMDGKVKYTNPSDDLNYLFSQILLYPNNTSYLSNFNLLIEQIPD